MKFKQVELQRKDRLGGEKMEEIDDIINCICDWIQAHKNSDGAHEMAKALAELLSAKTKINMTLRLRQGKKINH